MFRPYEKEWSSCLCSVIAQCTVTQIPIPCIFVTNFLGKKKRERVKGVTVCLLIE